MAYAQGTVPDKAAMPMLASPEDTPPGISRPPNGRSNAHPVEPTLTLPAHHDYFEVRDAGIKGVGVFATTDIPANTCILHELPLLILKASPSPADVLEAHAKLSEKQKMEYAKLRTVFDIHNRDTSMFDFDSPSIHRIYRHFGVSNRDELMVFMRSNSNRMPGDGVVGIFDLSCRFNHTCYKPNVERRGDPLKRMECWTLRPIKQGEELLGCYTSVLFRMTTEERKKAFPKNGYLFNCECTLCTAPPTAPERLISDMRRRLLRYLEIALVGDDPSPPYELDVENVQHMMLCEGMLLETNGWSEFDRFKVHLSLYIALCKAEAAIPLFRIANTYLQALSTLSREAQDRGLAKLSPAVLEAVRLSWPSTLDAVAMTLGHPSQWDDIGPLISVLGSIVAKG